jgi:hypothetical protein
MAIFVSSPSTGEDEGEGAYHAPSSLPSPARGEGSMHRRTESNNSMNILRVEA